VSAARDRSRHGLQRAVSAVRTGLAATALVLLLPGPAQSGDRGSVLAGYSFEDDVATGPDTFAIWRGARGHVVLSRAVHQSGGRSVELRDVPGDGDFPELQGYFAARRSGRLYFHFALLTTDPGQELNVALAGPRSFQMDADGIAVWLATRDGWLVHVSDSIPKKLFRPDAFVWYGVDVAYSVDAGRYALRIRREGEEAPLVDLRGQPNATSRPGSAVDKFSFVGAPFTDRSSVTYYVDDVVIGTDEAVLQTPFAAPGRRRLFVEQFLDMRRRLDESPRCLPPLEPADIGLVEAMAGGAPGEEDLGFLDRALAAGASGGAPFPAQVEPGRVGASGSAPGPLGAVRAWRDGCVALELADPASGLAAFDRALELAPRARLFALSRVLALAALDRIEEADVQLAELAPSWREDPRYVAASAFVGLRRGDLDRAEDVLHDAALRVLDRDASPGRLEETQLAEQYFHVQLWQGRYDLARDYARVMAERHARAGASGAVWVEREGDAAFLERDLALARELYTEAGRDPELRTWIDLKLADVAFLEGDVEGERILREKHYGALHE
jgi:hypothetical protein